MQRLHVLPKALLRKLGKSVERKGRLVSPQFLALQMGRGENSARVAGLLALLAAVVAVFLIAGGCGAATDPPLRTRHSTARRSSRSSDGRLAIVALTIRPGEHASLIPRSFLGLSTEYWTLALDERHVALYRRVVSLLHVPGNGALILRIGGDSSDRALYDPQTRRGPRWAFALTPRFATRTERIVRALHLHVILDLNLLTASPMSAAAWATEAEKAFPRGSIIGYEIGNEPDLYGHAFWLRVTQPNSFAPLLPGEATPAAYAADYDAFAQVVRRIGPGVPLLGPAVSNPASGIGWIRALLERPHPRLREITAHLYPYSGCAIASSPRHPTIDRILSEQASAGMARSVRPMVLLARRAGLAARLTEFNSVTCGGLRGVSNSFATALWAPDAIFALIRAGLSGANLHVRLHTINSPFTFDSHGLLARPLLYGLILFTRMIGPGAQLMPVQLHSPSSPRLTAWAVEVAGHQLHVLLIDKGPRSAIVNLDLPATEPATVQRLLAPSVSSRSGVTLAGQAIGEHGGWRGRRQIERVRSEADHYAVTVSPYSAALLSVATTIRRETKQRKRPDPGPRPRA
jgi:hypothetical protein